MTTGETTHRRGFLAGVFGAVAGAGVLGAMRGEPQAAGIRDNRQ